MLERKFVCEIVCLLANLSRYVQMVTLPPFPASGDDKYNWFYHTVPQKHMDNRVMYWPRGRVWGGSSALNAMVYIRGHALDYDRWVDEGAKGGFLR